MSRSEKMNPSTNHSRYLVCEQKGVYILLMCAAGMMGAYTFNLRGGVFCNAQTANFVMMAVSFGQGQWLDGCYYLIPIFAYFSGAFFSEILPSPVKRLKFLRWDTYLIGFEIFILLLVGLIPLSWPDHLVQIMINFIASMQYNTFRQAMGIPMATTFCTNHLRQTGIALAKLIQKKDRTMLRREAAHVEMLLSFLMGGILLTAVCPLMREKAVWLTLIPLSVIFVRMVHADLTFEHDLLNAKPSGH